jgi:hypothetical protein
MNRAENALAVLIGKPLSATSRVLEMEMFEFGAQTPFTDRHGRQRTIGEYRLHVQCAWRIVAAGRVVVGYSDVHDAPVDPPPDAFDPERDPTLRDVLLERFLSERQPRVVTECETTTAGDVRLKLEDEAVLELLPMGTAGDVEYWRLLLPTGGDIVMSASGFERSGPKHERDTQGHWS